VGRIPIEDLGLVVVDSPQVSLSTALMRAMAKSNVVMVVCDEQHLPAGMYQSLQGHTLMAGVVDAQLEASKPLKKQLWRQTVVDKIANQAKVLHRLRLPYMRLSRMATEVRSGDSSNREAAAAAYYWKQLFGSLEGGFRRDRYGHSPNNLLNYGYSIIRSTVARGLVSSGLLPMIGIHHKNRLNPYRLADDIMEPYRPMVDWVVQELYHNQLGQGDTVQLDKAAKLALLGVLTMDVLQDEVRSPLSVAIQRTCQSLAKCFQGEKRRIAYATFLPIQ